MPRRIRGCLGTTMQAKKRRIAAVIMRAFSGFAALASGATVPRCAWMLRRVVITEPAPLLHENTLAVIRTAQAVFDIHSQTSYFYYEAGMKHLIPGQSTVTFVDSSIRRFVDSSTYLIVPQVVTYGS
jgi:hypothetical protein